MTNGEKKNEVGWRNRTSLHVKSSSAGYSVVVYGKIIGVVAMDAVHQRPGLKESTHLVDYIKNFKVRRTSNSLYSSTSRYNYMTNAFLKLIVHIVNRFRVF